MAMRRSIAIDGEHAEKRQATTPANPEVAHGTKFEVHSSSTSLHKHLPEGQGSISSIPHFEMLYSLNNTTLTWPSPTTILLLSTHLRSKTLGGDVDLLDTLFGFPRVATTIADSSLWKCFPFLISPSLGYGFRLCRVYYLEVGSLPVSQYHQTHWHHSDPEEMAKFNNLQPPLEDGFKAKYTSTNDPLSGNSSRTIFGEMDKILKAPDQDEERATLNTPPHTNMEKNFIVETDRSDSFREPNINLPFRRKIKPLFATKGKLRPFRLIKQDVRNIRKRYLSDWTTFNQLVFASAVYVFFTNILPGITFASDLYVRTGKSWGTIEIVFSTGLCGIIFSM